jgi:hypothetical protein
VAQYWREHLLHNPPQAEAGSAGFDRVGP